MMHEKIGMAAPKQLYEVFPTDVRYVNSFVNIKLDVESIRVVMLAQREAIEAMGLLFDESMNFCNWVLRHALNNSGKIKVFDYEPNSLYEEVYDRYFHDEEYYINNTTERMLEQLDFRPTMVQCFVIGSCAILSFGASNAQTFQTQPTGKSVILRPSAEHDRRDVLGGNAWSNDSKEF